MSPRLGSWDPPDCQTPAEQRTTLLYGGIWLVFMLWPLAIIVTSGVGALWTVIGVLALLVFVAVYLFALTHPKILASVPRPISTLLYTAIMAAMVGLMMPAAGVAILTSSPFFMALWLFSYKLGIGVVAALLIAMSAILTGHIVYPDHPTAALEIPVGMTFIILIIVRISTERDEQDRQLSENLALSEQREELGRTVHDVLGHSLTAITVNAQLARRLIRTDPEAAEEQIDYVLSTARKALGEVRQTVVALNQPELAEQLMVAREVLRHAGISARVPTEPPEIPEKAGELFAWCLREGVTNVVRHSGAKSCRISLGESYLRVDDDGNGLTSPEGNGLRGLRARVEQAGGTLTVEDHPDHPGTRMEVTL